MIEAADQDSGEGMVMTMQRLLTAEEFACLPDPLDGSQQELVKGIVIGFPLRGGRHGLCCSSIATQLHVFVEGAKLGWVCCNNTGIITARNPDSVRGPDVSFWNLARLPMLPEGYLE